LDQNSAGALSLDRRLAGAHFVDPAANNFKRLFDRAVIGGQFFRLRQLNL
jgi:hypothetical protein